MAEWSAFWSYVHLDNDGDGGRILDLRLDIAVRMRLRTGHEFEIFADRTDLKWGDDWQSKLDEVILQTAFLIPVVTPSYILSGQCRRELLSFSAAAESLGLTELILPIYYVSVDQLETYSEGEDEVADLIHRFQWQDFREAALEDKQSSTYRKAVDKLATELISRAQEADSKPALTSLVSTATINLGGSPGNPPRADGDAEEEAEPEDEDWDVLDKLAEAEAAFPRLNETTIAINPIIARMGTDAEAAAAAMTKSDEQGKGFAGRLTASRIFARKLTEAADELEPLVQAFIADLRIIDPSTRLTLRMIKEQGQIEESGAYIDAISAMAESGIPSIDQMLDLANSVLANAKWSKDLRAPSARIGAALRQLSDARTVFEDWQRLVHDIRPAGG
jgi:hypothetical protein